MKELLKKVVEEVKEIRVLVDKNDLTIMEICELVILCASATVNLSTIINCLNLSVGTTVKMEKQKLIPQVTQTSAENNG